MTPTEIKGLLTEKGFTQGDLHRKWKIPRGTISQLVNRKMRSARLEKRLARVLGVTVEDMLANHKPVNIEIVSR